MRGSFDEVVDETIDALEDEGFGVLTDVDVQATFAAKLDEEFRQYRILGACNPGLAHEALGEEIELGALLPCNVVVYETDEGAISVNAVDAMELLDLAESSELDVIGEEVHERYERVVETIDDSVGDADA
ncbi:hypothetical protein C479_05588 [Halovivax asiaticus JCM 14624]|uniref:DUF302 domain-containing protein n=1 Tax=Halovivax asiaticus JCM 14624 TaxID=1227490 RepID=M0BN13_9EURY|nr:hypothetical protein C479_05588 [Halovivax asiaticus JCM 14624]